MSNHEGNSFDELSEYATAIENDNKILNEALNKLWGIANSENFIIQETGFCIVEEALEELGIDKL